MALKGKEKEVKNYTKYVGMFNGNIVTVNPTKDEMEKILGINSDKEPEYMSENQENGAKRVTLSFWLKEVSLNTFFNVRFNLEDTVKVAKSGNKQFINSIGTTSYADDIDNVPDFIKENDREIRLAKNGEESLYKFLRAWLSQLNYGDPNTELKLDWKTLMKGNMKELREAINNFSTQAVCAMATVRTAEDGKEYQSVYPYEFLPEYAYNCFTGVKGKRYKSVDKFIEKVSDIDYGCKDYYELVPIKEYDPTKNVVNSTNKPILDTNKPSSKIETAPVSTKSQTLASVTDDIDDDLPF